MAREYSSLWEVMQAARVEAALAYAEAADAADEEYQAAISQPGCDYMAAWSRWHAARQDAEIAYDNAVRQAILAISDGLARGGLEPPCPTGIGRLRSGELPCLQALSPHSTAA